MRLSSVRLSGFKSFVGPLQIDLPAQLTGVVGPNGCGKSNVIDAVRWVLGEVTRNIRGETLGDIIFDGSASAARLDQASVEVILDNEMGRIGGEYAAFSEIKIRREVRRDTEQQSRYFINGTRVRRKDVSDMFQGTGLGRGNYAIIAQGTIQGLIEAQPEDLRKYIEEAAGISLYRERRRETENKIRRTEENLARSRDILLEHEERLKHLERQKRQAEQYQKLKQKLSTCESEWIGLQWQEQHAQLETVNTAHEEISAQRDKREARLTELESTLEEKRSQSHSDVEEMEAAQNQSYQLQTEYQECGRLQREIEEHAGRLSEAQAHLQRIETDRGDYQSQLDSVMATRSDAEKEATRLEAHWSELQQQRDTLRNQVTATREERSTESASLHQYEDELRHLWESGAASPEDKDPKAALDRELDTAKDAQERCRERLEANQRRIREAQQQREVQGQAVARVQEEKMKAQGRLASLEVMQNAELANDPQAHEHALQAMNLKGTRLADHIEVDSGWEFAVETVLAESLGAFCVDALPQRIEEERIAGTTALRLLDQSTTAASETPDSLAQHVTSSHPLGSLLAGVLAVDTVEEANALRASLEPHQSVITRNGLWLGPNWMRLPARESRGEGVLERQREMDALSAELERLEGQLEESERQRRQAEQDLEQAESLHAGLQEEYDQAFEACALLRARVQGLEGQEERLEGLQGLAQKARDRLSVLESELSEREGQLTDMETSCVQASEAAQGAQLKVREQGETCNQLQVQLSTAQTQAESLRTSFERDAQMQATRTERFETLIGQAGGEGEVETLLEHKKAQMEEAQQRVYEMRKKSESLRATQETLEKDRAQAQRVALEVREQLHEKELERQQLRDTCDGLNIRIEESGFELKALLASLPKEASVEVWEAKVLKLNQRVQRMPPINAAAISEYEESQQQAETLKAQHEDIEQALSKLTDAMATIDRETRERFRRTFDQVNANLQKTFPRMIGQGGEANLTLTEQNVLHAGVEVRAKPPGKRYRSMHMLSGGEQAMVAASLILSLFSLNPAPFCILDEVDAPLSDDNLRRFSEILVEMSESIQFIVITHNKVTMEHMDQLVGVTMNEPGVSRLVSVDVAAAMAMAEQEGS